MYEGDEILDDDEMNASFMGPGSMQQLGQNQ
jgi:hypothetical protein